MAHDDLIYEVEERAAKASARYGDFASTHEALGVALEEWTELVEAVRSNQLSAVEYECLDLASVLVRLARSIRNSASLQSRSIK